MENSNGKERKILDMIVSEYSWEQILYKVIAWEGLDPWDLDIGALSGAFLSHIKRAKELDFRLPAKYILLASVLLRMKSEYIKMVRQEEPELEIEGAEIPGEVPAEIAPPKIEINAITAPPKRVPRRKIVVTELVDALRRSLAAQERREKKTRTRGGIVIEEDDITERIEGLYSKISGIMSSMKAEEVKFSGVVGKWDRNSIVDAFLPLVYLDHQRRVDCRQEELFKEILIKKTETARPGRLASLRMRRGRAG